MGSGCTLSAASLTSSTRPRRLTLRTVSGCHRLLWRTVFQFTERLKRGIGARPFVLCRIAFGKATLREFNPSVICYSNGVISSLNSPLTVA